MELMTGRLLRGDGRSLSRPIDLAIDDSMIGRERFGKPEEIKTGVQPDHVLALPKGRQPTTVPSGADPTFDKAVQLLRESLKTASLSVGP
jgi:hypothetical protein